MAEGEKLTFQLPVPSNNFVVLHLEKTLQLALVSFQLPVVPKEILEEPSPKVVGILQKKGNMRKNRRCAVLDSVKYLKLNFGQNKFHPKLRD